MKPENIRHFDVHSHLNFPQFEADREAVIAEMVAKNIATITVGTGLETSRQAVWLAEKYENLWAAVGFHPLDAGAVTEGDFAELKKIIGKEKVVAIGECGLDYSRPLTEDEKKKQKEGFLRQVELAVAADKPLIIHCRDAYEDVLGLLAEKKKEYGERLRGDFHFFTSPVDVAKKCLELGFYVSFTGPITFTKQYDEVVAFVPLEKIMIETDAPYAAPARERGRRNSPLYVGEMAEKIALIKKVALDVVEKTLVNNAFELFFKKN